MFPDWLESQSGERTHQELGKKLWSHITQNFSRVIIKSWCLLENCTHGEATDVGVTHSQSLVARQEAVLGRCAFATWGGQSCSVGSVQFLHVYLRPEAPSYFLPSIFHHFPIRAAIFLLDLFSFLFNHSNILQVERWNFCEGLRYRP